MVLGRRPSRTAPSRYPATVHAAVAAAGPLALWPTPLVFVPRTDAPSRPAASRLEGNWIWVCPAVVLVVGMIDTACTLAALKMGMLVELNPIMALMIEKGGPLGLALYRAAATLLGCGLLLWALRMYRDGRINRSALARTRGLVWLGQAVLVVAHLALAAWWTVWFLV